LPIRLPGRLEIRLLVGKLNAPATPWKLASSLRVIESRVIPNDYHLAIEEAHHIANSGCKEQLEQGHGEAAKECNCRRSARKIIHHRPTIEAVQIVEVDRIEHSDEQQIDRG
jgi:hypothetical protein